MIEVQKEYIIKQSQEVTYQFISNPENDLKWMSSAAEVAIKTEDTYDITLKFFGKKMTFGIEMETTPNSCHDYRTTSGPLSFEGRYAMEPVAEGTKVTWTFKADPKNFFGLVPKVLLKNALDKQADKDIAALQKVMESYEPATV